MHGRRTSYSTDEEKALLAFTEAVTLISNHVPDEVYANAAKFFDRNVFFIIMAIVAINAWNRIAITTQLLPLNRIILIIIH